VCSLAGDDGEAGLYSKGSGCGKHCRTCLLVFVFHLCVSQPFLLLPVLSRWGLQTPHYQVTAHGLPEFYERVLKAGLQCAVYPPDCSCVKLGRFLRNWNYGTPEWDDIQAEYDAWDI
jgi:hypothetical protein